MAGRGRGRGRGRNAISFDYSQVGFNAAEPLPPPVLQPPPVFPPLEHKPAPLKSGPESEYMVALRRDFVEFLKYSLSFKQNGESSSVIERFSDKYQNATSDTKEEPSFFWDRMPSELKAKQKQKGTSEKRKRGKQTQKKSLKKVKGDLTNRLDELVKLEEKPEESESGQDSEGKDEDDNESGQNEEVEDIDEEMDDGTDYVNNYFDNGDGYLDDDDDNLDNGPVY